MNQRFETSTPLPTRHGSLPMRLGALTLAASMLWSLGLAGAARAVTYKAPLPPSHVRTLTPAEMNSISGAQTVNHPVMSSECV